MRSRRSATRWCASSKSLSRSIDWAYSDPHAIDNYAEIAKVPRALAQQTRDEFFPKQSLQLAEVKGLDVTLKQALEFKYIHHADDGGGGAGNVGHSLQAGPEIAAGPERVKYRRQTRRRRG